MIETYFNNLMQEVERKMGIESSRMEGEQVIRTCQEMVSFLRERSRELKDYVLNHPFSNVEEEICFFKYYKPALTGRLLYYYRVYQIESGCSCCPEIARMHYRKVMKEYQRKLERYLPFYQYYRSGATYRDHYYFRRAKKELSPESGSFMLEEDSVMSTGYDLLAARLIAAEMLLGYLNRKVLLAMEGAYVVQEKEHHWTDRKAAAVELIYGIWAMGSVDNGRVSIVELVMLFEQMFHIDLGDVYHTFISMRNRKNSRTAYLDQMKERLLKRMDETDG
ncbi:RteC domain-containing protein [Bacteroides caccae]|uniref:RteC domain-containing protein n=1 Tax=Bacteroides caccae TaxID=47678 RepID=UPI0021659DA7|nr:RteC domain-containing protein [Bacteroides caccae]MCS2365495.1 RteC domain-containing protein [Bacteroides caccae]MCS3190258.1 RteC domain-containing protein [Bacteroides caccae]